MLGVCREQSVHLCRVHGARVEIALSVGAVQLDETVALAADFDAFGDGFESERGGEADDQTDESPLLAVVVLDAVDERFRDLENVNREAAQIAQGRVAGAEVVDRELDAETPELRELDQGTFGVVEQASLGDLQNECGGR